MSVWFEFMFKLIIVRQVDSLCAFLIILIGKTDYSLMESELNLSIIKRKMAYQVGASWGKRVR